MERIDCEPTPKCLQWPNCFKVVVEGTIVCSGIYAAMIESLPGDYDVIDPEEFDN
jgi:hypothetical protein